MLGNLRIKDLFGTHPKLFNVFHKCLFPTDHRHLLKIFFPHFTFPVFTLSPSYFINVLNLYKWFISFADKESSKIYFFFFLFSVLEIYPSA